MTKKPRLRVQKEKRGRRLIPYLLFFAILCIAGYHVEQQFKVSTYAEEVFTNLKKSFSGDDPIRGTIYDRNLKQIATTMERVAVYARTREIRSIQETVSALGKTLGIDEKILQQKLESGILRQWIKEDISQEQEENVKNLDLPGIYFQREEKRYYPNGPQAAHLIGYVEDGIGLSGVEFYYDRLLASRKLKQQEERKPLSNAQDLVLTIDLKIQDILEGIVEEIQKNESAESVAAYLMESRTGEIIGGAQLPGFDPNVFTRYSHNTLDNIFLDSLYIPRKFRKFLGDTANLIGSEGEGTGPLPWSIVEVENDLGSQIRLWDRLGLSDEDLVDFQAPSQGTTVKPESRKALGPLLESSVLVPEKAIPIKLLAAFSVLLYNGEKIKPFTIKKILDPDTGAEVLVSRNGAGGAGPADRGDGSTSEVVRMFRSQADEGPLACHFFRDEIVMAIGTGTSRRYLVDDFTWVTIPAGEKDLNMLVIVQRPPQGVSDKKETWRTLEQIVGDKVGRISILQQVSKTVADVVEPELAGDGNYQEEEPTAIELHTTKKDLDRKEIIPEIMPDLKGLSLRKSLRLLQGLELKINIEGTGRVVSQKPLPGEALKGISECSLILEKTANMYPENVLKGNNEN